MRVSESIISSSQRRPRRARLRLGLASVLSQTSKTTPSFASSNHQRMIQLIWKQSPFPKKWVYFFNKCFVDLKMEHFQSFLHPLNLNTTQKVFAESNGTWKEQDFSDLSSSAVECSSLYFYWFVWFFFINQGHSCSVQPVVSNVCCRKTFLQRQNRKKDAARARGNQCKLNFLLSVDGNTFGSTHQQEAGPRTASICLY